MEIESISPENIKPLTELVLALWEECSFEEEYENCRRILQAEDETCFLINEDENYVAFIYLTIRTDYVEGSDTSPVAYIEGLYVKPGFRGQQLGRKLIEAGEEWAGQKGCKQIGADTEITNEQSIAFQKRVGFKEVNRIVCFIREIK